MPKLTDNRAGRAARASASSPASLRITQSTRPIPNVPRTCRNSACSSSLVATLPMPTMPRPPAAVTAAARCPPATPPIGALTMGTRRPKLLDQGVDNTGGYCAAAGKVLSTVSMTTESSTACRACRCAGSTR